MKQILIILLLGNLLYISSCENEKLPVPNNTLPTNVSLANDVMPIFSKSCSTSGCHDAGGIPPDLSEANAYNSMIFGGQVNTTNPEQSIIYKRMLIDMPPSGLVSQQEKNIVLGWITEGAKEN